MSSAGNTIITTAVLLAFASVGGLILFIVAICAVIFAVYSNTMTWKQAAAGLFILGTTVSIVCMGVAVGNNTTDPAVLRAGLIVQAVINGFLVCILGYSAYRSVNDNMAYRSQYIMSLLPIILVLSVVSLSSTAMNQLAS